MLSQTMLVIALLTAVSLAQENAPAPNRKATAVPRSREAPVSRPSESDEKRQLKAPPLAVSSDQVKEAVRNFVAWAGASNVRQREEARRVINEARENKAVASALCEEASRSQRVDHSRTLLVLSILGEMRNPAGEQCLRGILHQPFPETGTWAHGEIVEQTALGILQAKAVDGLAYLHTPSGDEEVLWAAGKHPSRIVRAEAIEAYLWNHDDSQEARARLSRYIRPEEKIFLDRVRRAPEESGEVFNRKLATFLKAHPETAAPAPEHLSQRKGPRGEQKPPAR
jgi:hypothetical protein